MYITRPEERCLTSKIRKLPQIQSFDRLVFYLIFAALLILFPSCGGTALSQGDKESQKWAEEVANKVVLKIKKGHPKIFLNRERIQDLKSKIRSNKEFSGYFHHIQAIVQAGMEGPHPALLYALGDSQALGLARPHHEYGRMAANTLMRAMSEKYRHHFYPLGDPDDLAILYDWAYNALTDQEKRAFVNYCKSRLGDNIRIHDGKQHGYRSSPRPNGLIAALSFYGDGIDDEYAKRLLVQGIRDTLLDNLAQEHVAGKDGGFADGTGYFLQNGGTFFPFLAISIATESNFFFEHEVLTRMPNHLMYAMLPFPIKRLGSNYVVRYFATFHDNWTATPNDYGSPRKWATDLFAIVASEYRRHDNERMAGLYTWFLKEVFGGIEYQAANPITFVLMDWSIQLKSPKELGLPLAKALGWDEEKGEIDRDRFGKKGGIGWVCIRSDWQDPDATFAIFKAEPFYYHGHMHRDSLAFMIAKGEELALARAGNYMCWYEGGSIRSPDPGWPQMANFFSRTISTSNLLIFNPAEKFNEDSWLIMTNDGGQRLTEGWDRQWGRTYNGTADGNFRDIGGLIRFERTKNYVYAAADATRAYNSRMITSRGNPPKVNLVQREFVYLGSSQGDKDYFIIFDRVDSVQPEFKKFWLLQLRAKPEFNGSYRVVVGSDSGGIHLSQDTSSFYVQQERAELSGKVLLPKEGNRVVRRLGGWVTTHLKQPLKANDNGPLDIEVESTEGFPDHPVVIITAKPPDPNREVFDRYLEWPIASHANTNPAGERICYFCDGKTPSRQRPAKLLNCVRATKAAPGFAMPVGAKVIQEFRHMGIEGADKNKDSERINYPWGYGLGYNYGDGNQYGLWRIEVSPQKPSLYNNFLHVLHPSLKGKGRMEAELIESESGNIYGAKIQSKIVIFSKSPEPLIKGSYVINSAGTVWQLLCNLKPGKTYQIKQDDKPLLMAVASKQGTIQFESTGVNKNPHFEFKEVEEIKVK